MPNLRCYAELGLQRYNFFLNLQGKVLIFSFAHGRGRGTWQISTFVISTKARRARPCHFGQGPQGRVEKSIAQYAGVQPLTAPGAPIHPFVLGGWEHFRAFLRLSTHQWRVIGSTARTPPLRRDLAGKGPESAEPRQIEGDLAGRGPESAEPRQVEGDLAGKGPESAEP